MQQARQDRKGCGLRLSSAPLPVFSCQFSDSVLGQPNTLAAQFAPPTPAAVDTPVCRLTAKKVWKEVRREGRPVRAARSRG